MKLLAYQEQAKRTMPTLGICNSPLGIYDQTFHDNRSEHYKDSRWEASDILNSLHMTVGMNTEIGETVLCLKMSNTIDKVNLQEEIGDILWYFANYATVHDIDLSKYDFLYQGFYFEEEYKKYPNLRVYDLVLLHASDLLDYDKKQLAYRKSKDRLKVEKSFESLFQALADMFLTYGLDPYRAMQNNIDKLRVRYPEKFTTEHAINRDLDKERVELEK